MPAPNHTVAPRWKRWLLRGLGLLALAILSAVAGIFIGIAVLRWMIH